MLFGNLNEMATVWLFKYKDICDDIEHRCPDLYKLETKEADKVFKEESKFHEGLNTDLQNDPENSWILPKTEV